MAGDAALAGLRAYTVLHAVETLDVQTYLSCSGGETGRREGPRIARAQHTCGFDPHPEHSDARRLSDGSLRPAVVHSPGPHAGHTKVTSDLLR